MTSHSPEPVAAAAAAAGKSPPESRRKGWTGAGTVPEGPGRAGRGAAGACDSHSHGAAGDSDLPPAHGRRHRRRPEWYARRGATVRRGAAARERVQPEPAPPPGESAAGAAPRAICGALQTPASESLSLSLSLSIFLSLSLSLSLSLPSVCLSLTHARTHARTHTHTFPQVNRSTGRPPRRPPMPVVRPCRHPGLLRAARTCGRPARWGWPTGRQLEGLGRQLEGLGSPPAAAAVGCPPSGSPGATRGEAPCGSKITGRGPVAPPLSYGSGPVLSGRRSGGWPPGSRIGRAAGRGAQISTGAADFDRAAGREAQALDPARPCQAVPTLAGSGPAARY